MHAIIESVVQYVQSLASSPSKATRQVADEARIILQVLEESGPSNILIKDIQEQIAYFKTQLEEDLNERKKEISRVPESELSNVDVAELRDDFISYIERLETFRDSIHRDKKTTLAFHVLFWFSLLAFIVFLVPWFVPAAIVGVILCYVAHDTFCVSNKMNKLEDSVNNSLKDAVRKQATFNELTQFVQHPGQPPAKNRKTR